VVLALTFGPAPLGPGTGQASDPEPVVAGPDTPVVLVILDELPTATLLKADETIDARRFPNIARLASGSTWYRDNASAGDSTAWAVPPILTGNHSNDETLPTNAVQPDNIFNLLGPGRRVHAMEEVTELCSKKYCPDGHQGEATEEVLSSEFVKSKFEVPDMPPIFKWIDSMPAGKRTLSMLHLPLPHQPQRFLPGGQTYPGGPLGFTIPKINGWTISDAGISLVQQRHILQTAYTDRLVGRIMKKIRTNGDWDRSLVIFTADHGYSFDTRFDRRDLGRGNVAATVNPPLFIKYPGQTEAHVSRKSTQGVDLLPTIAEVLGVGNLHETDGIPISQVPENREMVVDKDLMVRTTIRTAQIRSQRPDLIKASIRRFGDGGLWSLGPKNGLIGTTPGRARKLADARVKIDFPERLRNFRPGTGVVPSLVSGELIRIAANEILAVAVNGRITGTTRTFRYEGAMRFGSMVPPSAFRRGANKVAVYLVGSGNSLRRIR